MWVHEMGDGPEHVFVAPASANAGNEQEKLSHQNGPDGPGLPATLVYVHMVSIQAHWDVFGIPSHHWVPIWPSHDGDPVMAWCTNGFLVGRLLLVVLATCCMVMLHVGRLLLVVMARCCMVMLHVRHLLLVVMARSCVVVVHVGHLLLVVMGRSCMVVVHVAHLLLVVLRWWRAWWRVCIHSMECMALGWGPHMGPWPYLRAPWNVRPWQICSCCSLDGRRPLGSRMWRRT